MGGEPFESSSTRNNSQNIARGTTDPEIDSCAVQRWNSNMALCCQVSQTLDKNVVFVSVRFGGREKGRGDCKLDDNYCRHTDGWTPLQTGSDTCNLSSQSSAQNIKPKTTNPLRLNPNLPRLDRRGRRQPVREIVLLRIFLLMASL